MTGKAKYQYAVEIRPQEIVAWVQVYGASTEAEAQAYVDGKQIKRHHGSAVRIVDVWA
jgi:hypothetical protein